MDNYSFNAEIVNISNTHIVTFPEVPEAITEGKNLAEAQHNAEDALSVALLGYVLDNKPLPKPKYNGGHKIILDPQTALKIALNQEFKKLGITKQDFGTRVGKSKTEIQRLLDPNHRSKLDAMSEIFVALDKRLVISVEAVK